MLAWRNDIKRFSLVLLSIFFHTDTPGQISQITDRNSSLALWNKERIIAALLFLQMTRE